MNFKQEIKTFYHNNIESRDVPSKICLEGVIFVAKERNQKRIIVQQKFVFQTVVILFFIFILIINAKTKQSLRLLDPDGKKQEYWSQKIRDGFRSINAYFRQLPIQPVEGEKK
jgi:hypothetical protein